MLAPATPSRTAGTSPRRLPGAVLTIRRQVDYCRVAAALCCPGRTGTALPH